MDSDIKKIIEKIKKYLEVKESLEPESCYFVTKTLNEEYWNKINEDESEDEEDEIDSLFEDDEGDSEDESDEDYDEDYDEEPEEPKKPKIKPKVINRANELKKPIIKKPKVPIKHESKKRIEVDDLDF